MVHNAIEKHIVTKGDYAMVPAGQRLFDCPNCKAGKGGKIFYNVAPGQLVAYTISAVTLQPITVDSTNLATVTGDLYIGVGIDADGDGAADDVRLLAGEKFDKCLIDELSVSAPVCGNPQVLGAYLECVKCWETYAVQFRYSDNRTRSFGLTRADQNEITAAFAPECNTCDDCEPAVNCDEVICKLVDSLNNEFDNTINGERYPDKKGVYLPKPYRAVRLHSNYDVFCINPIAAACDCEGCVATDAIVEATIASAYQETHFDVVFSGNLNPSNNAQTMLAQLQNIAQQLECGFTDNIGAHSGFAFVTGGGPDKCCPYQLHVVYCDDVTLTLHDTNGVMTACDAITTFPTFTDEITCVDCADPTASSVTPSCGLAVIIEQPTFDCGCYVDKPLTWYGRTGELTFIKNLDDYTPIVKATELMAPVFPENFGAWIKWLEYSQETGGKGREYRDVNAPQGWLRQPDSVSRAKNAPMFADCSKSYCTYFLGHNMQRFPSLTKSIAFNRLNSFVHIPSTDTNTVNDWEAFVAVLIGLNNSNCVVHTGLTCLQIEGAPTYVPVNTGVPAQSPAYTPTYAPNYTPGYAPSYAPHYTPTYQPTYTPNYTPDYTPVYTPTYVPIYAPTYAPTYTPIYTPIYTPT